jgi:nucleotide-binding universal stress UspA family protein
MMKTILVPASGSSTDEPVFATALAAAQALAAHLDFYHVRLSADQAAARAPYVAFCVGEALPAALQVLTEDTSRLSEAAREHMQSFCGRYGVEIRDRPQYGHGVSASFLEENDYGCDRLMLLARHSDLVVFGRRSYIDYLPSFLLEDTLMGCGRPILIAPDYSPTTLLGTVVVGWKETPQCARALSAAYPLLRQAEKVILLNVVEGGSGIHESLEHLAQQLKWHNMSVETHSITNTASIATQGVGRAAADLGADLLVVGAYGRRHLREVLFGGVTQSLLEHASMPVLMMH